MVQILYYAIYFWFAIVCVNTNFHTFCNYYVGPAVSCVGYVEAPLSRQEKLRVLRRFNKHRNYVAGGNQRLFPPAANMLKLRWVEELAHAAQRWADQCRPPASPEETDTCCDLFSVFMVQTPGVRVESLVDMWYMQNLSYNRTANENETNHNQKLSMASMFRIDSHFVGCGRSKFMEPTNRKLTTVFVCNIAPVGIEPCTRFRLPGPSASRCPLRSDRDEQYTNLCAYQTTEEELNEVLNRIANALAGTKPTSYNTSTNTRVRRELRRTESIQDNLNLDTKEFKLQNDTDPKSQLNVPGTKVGNAVVYFFALFVIGVCLICIIFSTDSVGLCRSLITGREFKTHGTLSKTPRHY